MESPYNTTFGTPDLCAWQPCEQLVWVQTRNPKHAAKLNARQDSQLVSWSVTGGYLRIFDFSGKTMAWGKRLLERYTKSPIRDS